MDVLAQEFLRALRGTRSQVAFSRRLGFASNVAAQWESGRRTPKAYDALGFCQRLNGNVMEAFERFDPASAHKLKLGEPRSLADWLGAQQGRTSLVDAAGRARLTRFQVARFVTGQSQPRLQQFFQLVEAFTARVTELIAALVDIRQLPSANAMYVRWQRLKSLFVRLPWVGPVIVLIETDSYLRSDETDDAFFTRRLGISPEMLSECLTQLSDLGLTKRDPSSNKWRTAAPVTVDTSDEARWHLQSHWAAVSAQRLSERRDADTFSYNVFAVSQTDLERIRALQRAYFRELRSIVASSTPSETAALVTMHISELSPER